MRLPSRAQISFEYVLIFIVVLMIAVPSIFLLREYVYESSDKIVFGNIEFVANEMLNAATEMYYRGAPSRTVLSAEMPRQIQHIAIVEISSQSVKDYLLVFNITTTGGSKQIFFESATPIKKGSMPSVRQNCYGSIGVECRLYFFYENETSPGIKNFKIEAKSDGVYIEGI